MNTDELNDDFEQIYKATNVKVLIYITSKCNDTSQIDDIFQETYMEFYKLLSNKGKKYIKNEEAIIMKIAKQKIYRHYRWLDRIKNIIPIIDNQTTEETFEVYEETEIMEIENTLIQKEMINEIKKFLDSKSLEIRKIFYLHYFFDLTIVEIAEQLSISESNVKNKLYRTLKDMRIKYRKEDVYD